MPIYWIVPILFFSISSLFSMLGIGGSVLFIPILYWLGLDFQTEAIPMGLLLNIISSSTAAMTYVKNKLVNSLVSAKSSQKSLTLWYEKDDEIRP